MNTTEIITAVAYANVPEGAQLVSQSHKGLEVTRLDAKAFQMGGMKLVEARMLADGLKVGVGDLEVADAAFFRKLHENVLFMRNCTLDALTIGGLEEDVVKEYDRSIQKVRELAKELGVTYEEPSDSLTDGDDDDDDMSSVD